MAGVYTQSLIQAAQQQMQALADTIPAGIPFDTSIKVGVPWHAIVQQAADFPIDLVVMSTHGRSGIKHLWMGSVAERVVQHAPCPVLVVRPRTGVNHLPHPGDVPRGENPILTQTT
jgi:universal stress protein A